MPKINPHYTQCLSNYLYFYKMGKKVNIIKKIITDIQSFADNQNFEWINDYSNAKDDLFFKCKSTGITTKISWSNLKKRKKIPIRNSIDYNTRQVNKLFDSYNITLISPFIKYSLKVKYVCNNCNKTYYRNVQDAYKCGECNNFYKTNKGINTVNVLRNPYINYNIYFVYIPLYNAYKIGLYKSNYITSRFNTLIEILNVIKLPLYKAYYLEQYIIKKYHKNVYTGLKFGGYTEAFNDTIDKDNVIRIMGASILDVEPRELLESLEADNQQPSFIEI